MSKSDSFAGHSRAEHLRYMSEQPCDLLVIGGGITGAGIALDAASRGMKTYLVEMQDFAAGTSSRSTKLVHGGLRYLKQFEVGMVAEVGKERAIVYENGPHVTTPVWMLLPIYKNGTFGKFSTSIGLRIYDFLAGVKRSERRSMLSRAQTEQREPLLRKEGLLGGGYYVEYRTDDARLTIEVMKEAMKRGATAVNYAKVVKFMYEEGRIVGAEVEDQLTGKRALVHARKIVNAAGPWVDELRELDKSRRGKMLQLTKGVHLVIDQSRFPLQQAIYFDTSDKRMMFAIPRDGKTYVGTTDTVFKEDIAYPVATDSDKAYILQSVNEMFPEVMLTEQDIESSWAGVRPLIYEEGKNPSEISRKDEIWVSPTGLVTIAGGKLTGYRKMAEQVVDQITESLVTQAGDRYPASSTKTMPISGGNVGGSAGYPQYVSTHTEMGSHLGLSREIAEHWASMYGSNVSWLLERYASYRSEAPVSGLPLEVLVPLQYALEEEMVVKPADFFIRRTGGLFFNISWVMEWKELVVSYMSQYFGWNAEQAALYQAELDDQLQAAAMNKGLSHK